MTIQYIENMKMLQKRILEYIDCDDETVEENYLNLQKLFNDMNIQENKYYLVSKF